MQRHNVFSSKVHILCFSKWGWAAILDLEFKMFQNRKITIFVGFVTPKIVEFSILYMHLYAYVLLSSKVIVFYVFKTEMGGHLEFRGQDVSKSKKKNSLVLPRQKL